MNMSDFLSNSEEVSFILGITNCHILQQSDPCQNHTDLYDSD